MNKIKVGVIGCGNISSIYFKVMQTFNILEVAACSDLMMERAKASAQKFKIPKACTVKELLTDEEIEIIVNLTIPKAHAEVSIASLESGKNVYGEKPLAVTREEGQKILKTAKKKKLRVGSAPDTFLGAGIQTCRKIIDDGLIGKPIACTAFMTCHGHESWHPDPNFYYQPGGGPMLDMGPYYLTALINLMGPVRRVTGSANITFTERTITSQPKYGTKIKVKTPTHIAGIMDFANGAVGTIITSFDIWAANLPAIEIYGTEGSLTVPDPNCFGGPVRLHKPNSNLWKDRPLSYGYAENSRGIGVADMASAIVSGRPHRANGEMAYHVLDIMQAFNDASGTNKHIEISSTCHRPEALPLGLRNGQVDK